MTHKPDIVEGLRQALLPYPGRANHVLRALVSCTIVVIISQSLQVPLLALSLIAVFFVTQTNVVITKLTGALFIVGSTVAIALSLLILKVTWDVPFLRILTAFTVFLGSVFLMRTSKIGVVFFIVAIVTIYTQSLVDSVPSAELLVRSILWVWVAVNYPIAVTLIVNTLFMPAEPKGQLRNAICSQLAFIIRQLDPDAVSERQNDDINLAGRDAQALYRLLRYTVMRNKDAGFNEHRYLELITTVSALRAASCQLPLAFSVENVQAAAALQKMLTDLMSAIEHDRPFVAEQETTPLSGHSVFALMRDTLVEYAQSDVVSENTGKNAPGAKQPFLINDAFTNGRYIIFSLKTLLTAAICYLFYTAVDWSGIHTIMLSCLIVAQPGLGNVQRKIILRLGGAAIGSLESFGPVTGLTEVRDRLVGILLGIIVAGAIHTIISPEREGEIMLQRLSKLIGGIKDWLSDAAVHQQKKTAGFYGARRL